MPRKPGSNITGAVRQRWLEMADDGMSAEAIARKERRDPRTVKSHLKTAAEEQQIRSARQEQIRAALQQHNTEVLGVVKDLSYMVGAPHDERLTPAGVFRSSSHVDYQPDGFRIDQETHEVTPPARAKLFALAREHLRGETPLWKNLDQLDAVKLKYIEKCIRLGVAVAQEIREATTLDPVPENGRPPGFHETMVSYVCRRAIEKVRGVAVREDPSFRIEGDPPSLRYGGSTLATGGPDLLERARNMFVRLSAELPDRPEVREIARLRDRSDELAMAIRDRAEDISLFPYIRGTCRVCKDYSL